MRVLFVVAVALARAARHRPWASDRYAQSRADRPRRVEVDERGRRYCEAQGRHAPGRGQAGGRRTRRPAARGRADRPARVRREGGRDVARGGLPGHGVGDPGRAAGQGAAHRRRQRAHGQGADADRQLAARHARRPRLLRGPPERDPGVGRWRQLRAAEPVRRGAGGCSPRTRPHDLGRRPAGQRARPASARVHRARRRRDVLGRAGRGRARRRAGRAARPRLPVLRAVGDRGAGRDRPGERAEPQRGPVPGHAHRLRPALVHARGARGPPRAGLGHGDPALRVGRHLDVADRVARPSGRQVAYEQGPLSGGLSATELGRVETAERPHPGPGRRRPLPARRLARQAAISTTSRSRSSSGSSSWPPARRSG